VKYKLIAKKARTTSKIIIKPIITSRVEAKRLNILATKSKSYIKTNAAKS